jgi:hypothetical protein
MRRVVSTTDPHGRILGFLDRSRYYFFQVAPRLSLRGWVDPVPDPLLLRKSGSAGNGARDLWIYNQELWPPDHRGGQSNGYVWKNYRCQFSRDFQPFLNYWYYCIIPHFEVKITRFHYSSCVGIFLGDVVHWWIHSSPQFTHLIPFQGFRVSPTMLKLKRKVSL